MKSLAAALLILATALTVYWQPLTKQTPLKPSDVLFLIGLAAWGLHLLYERRIPSIPVSSTLSFLALFASIVAATVIGYFRNALPMSPMGGVLLGRLALSMMLFAAVYTLAQAKGGFRKMISLAFLSPLLLFVVLLVPRFAATMWEAGGEPRFQGLTPNANTADLAFVIGFAFAYTFAIHQIVSRRWLRGLAYTLVSAGMVVLVVWTHSRDYLFSTFVCATLGGAMIASHLALSRLKVVITTALGYVVVAMAILVLAPRSFTTFIARVIPSHVEDPRIFAAGYYSRLLSTNYFGLGVNYETRFKVRIPSTGELSGTNTILDVPVYGGIGAVLSIGYLLFQVARNVNRKLSVTDDPNIQYTIGAAIALGGLWIAAIPLGSPLFDYQFWILLAIALQE